MVKGQDRTDVLFVAEAARRAGMNPSAVRFYERRGLLPRPGRTSSGYRVLDEEAVERLRFIRHAQALGLRLSEVREILRLRDHGEIPCKRVQELAATRRRAIDEKIAELRRFRGSLTRLLVRASTTRPARGHICSLIETATKRRSGRATARGARRSGM